MAHTQETVGIIGLGLVGSALAERLLGAGYAVSGYDIRPEQTEQLRALGGSGEASAGAVAAVCRRVILSLPTSDVAGNVLHSIRPRLAGGAIVVDTTTGEPEESAAFGSFLAESGAAYLDATVAGSSRQVREGQAIAICGGESKVFDECGDLFECCFANAYHVGPCGSGARMKLVVNLVLGLNRAVLAEGLCFASACGIDPQRALEILKAGPAYSRAMDTKGRKMLERDFTPEARLSQHLKDVRLILGLGARNGARLPLSSLHRELLERAEAAGFGASDNSAIIQAFEKD